MKIICIRLEKKAMVNIVGKNDCCGCTACYNICPERCITMQPDVEGFLYPYIDEEKCINCNMCKKNCPILGHKTVEKEEPNAFVIRTKNQKDLMVSTSGGFSTPLAHWVFSQGGSVWTASYDEEWNVVHKQLCKSDYEFDKSRGSKYVQSYLGDTYQRIKKELNKGNKVCFIGTTCQVYGLNAYLQNDFDNLITVDLVCHGVPSPKLWRKYIDYQKSKYNSEIININFRNKTYGYHSSTMMLEFKNGKKYYGSARVDYMLKSFFSEISSRPSCYNCKFKAINRISDYTLFDCWHMSELLNKKDDDKGYTNILVHTEKGMKILNEINEEYNIFSVDAKNSILLDGVMVCNSAVPHHNRKIFYSDLDEHDLDEHINKYIKISLVDRIIESVKGIAYKLKLIGILKKIKR